MRTLSPKVVTVLLHAIVNIYINYPYCSQMLNADEEVKKRFRLAGKTAADFKLTAKSQRGHAPGVTGFAWRSEPQRGGSSQVRTMSQSSRKYRCATEAGGCAV